MLPEARCREPHGRRITGEAPGRPFDLPFPGVGVRDGLPESPRAQMRIRGEVGHAQHRARRNTGRLQCRHGLVLLLLRRPGADRLRALVFLLASILCGCETIVVGQRLAADYAAQ